MKVNLSDVEAKEFQLYESGPYRVKIESIEDVQAQSGNAQLRVKTKFINGQYQDKQLTDHITLVESVAWKVKKFFFALGMKEESEAQIDTESGSFRNMLNKSIGKSTIWVVGQKTGQDGVLRNVVLDYKEDPDAVQLSDENPEFLKKTVKEPVKAEEW